MNFDPRDPLNGHRRPRQSLTRRNVLQGGFWLTVGLGTTPLLAGCGKDQTPAAQNGEAPYPLARPDSPVTLDIAAGNEAIGDGLQPETGGTFNILNYADYMAPGVMKDFGKKYDVQLEVTPYSNYDQMLAKINEPGAAFDLVFPGPSVLSKMAYTELIQPLNQTYLPNLSNLWPEYQDPWYDQGAQYTVPYTVYTTGVGYRADRVATVPDVGYDLMWDEQYAGKVYVLDDPGEAIAMSILRNDLSDDINVTDPTIIQEAVDSLIELVDLVNVKTSISAYSMVPEGTATVHQTWSGDMIASQYYLPKDESTEVLAYWVSDDVSQRVIGNDVMAIPGAAAKPVLAHLLMNDLLDNDISLRNFGWNGYQPPISKLSPQYLVDQGYIPENLMNTVVLPEDFRSGMTLYELSPSAEALWRTAWAKFKAGA